MGATECEQVSSQSFRSIQNCLMNVLCTVQPLRIHLKWRSCPTSGKLAGCTNYRTDDRCDQCHVLSGCNTCSGKNPPSPLLTRVWCCALRMAALDSWDMQWCWHAIQYVSADKGFEWNMCIGLKLWFLPILISCHNASKGTWASLVSLDVLWLALW